MVRERSGAPPGGLRGVGTFSWRYGCPSWRSRWGREALAEIREALEHHIGGQGGPRRGPGVVEMSIRRSGRGRYVVSGVWVALAEVH